MPADPLLHFILEAVDALDLRQVQVNTLCTFRRENAALLTQSLVKVLPLAQQLKLLKLGQFTVAADGAKVLAHASKHSALSHQRAGEMIAPLEREVAPLLARAEQADATPLQEGRTIPEEITRRQQRRAALAQARAESEARAPARCAVQLAEPETKLAARAAKKERGEKVGVKPPQAPTPPPEPGDPYHFTDPESRIMKAGNGNHFEQSCNTAAAVEVESRLIVGPRVSQAPNDQQELGPTLAAIPAEAGTLTAARVDRGFFSEKAVRQVEGAGVVPVTGPVVYAAVEKTGPQPERGGFGTTPGTGTARRRRGLDGSDAAPLEDHRRQVALQAAATDRGTGLGDHQVRAGVPAVSVAGAGERVAGVDAGLPGLQSETAASAGRGSERGCPALKKREGSRQNRLHLVATVVARRKITHWVPPPMNRNSFPQPFGPPPPPPRSQPRAKSDRRLVETSGSSTPETPANPTRHRPNPPSRVNRQPHRGEIFIVSIRQKITKLRRSDLEIN